MASWLVVALGCLSVFPAFCADLGSTLDSIFLPEESWSVAVADLSQRKILYQHRAGEARVPASNLKVYVTSAAFDLLGTRFRFRTPLLGQGQFDSRTGVWRGDLLVRGSGDPTFSGRFEHDNTDVTGRLERWAQRLVNHGVRVVEGSVYGDDNIYDEDYWGMGWPEGSWCDWYTAPSGGLILNDGCIDIAVYPNKQTGKPPLVSTVPDTGFVKIQNDAVTVGPSTKAAISFQRSFGQNDLKLVGKVPVNSRGSQHCVALSEPTLYFVTVLKEVLEKRGIEVMGEAIDADLVPDLPTRGWKVLAVNESPPLTDIVKVVNTRSQNLFADSLLKTLGARKAGLGSWAGGAQVVKDWVRSLGIPAEHLHLQDGSGLSRLDRVTAFDTASLLVAVSQKPWFWDWKQSLAASGDSEGSLRSRLQTPLLKGKVRAKTGFINDVYCISGYVESRKGNSYAFSLLFNGKSHGGKHPHQRMEEALTVLAMDDFRTGEPISSQ